MAHAALRGRGHRKKKANRRGVQYGGRRAAKYEVRVVGTRGPHVRPCGNYACDECYTKDQRKLITFSTGTLTGRWGW